MKAEFVTSAVLPEQWPPGDLPEVAFLGRSNVGKSSLINKLTGQRGMAFTSSTPGRTQLINFYRVDEKLHLVDLPGYGYAKVPVSEKNKWQVFVEKYIEGRENLKLAVLILDSRRGWMEMDLGLRDWLVAHGKPYLVVATKTDKLNRKEEHHGIAGIQKELQDAALVVFSAISGRGVREIWQAISKIHNPPPLN